VIVLGTALSHTFHFLLATHPLMVIAALIFIEELGVPSPVPGDLMMLLAGVEVAQHRQHLWVILLVMELATIAGASGLFGVSRRVGRPFVTRYGRFIHLTPERLAEAVRIVNRPVLTEASGAITPESIVEVARSGVGLISCGSITHRAPPLDLGLDMC